MSEQPSLPPCASCRDGQALDFDFSMAFQPIIDLRDRSLHAYEALVRDIDTDPVRQAIVQGILGVCRVLDIEVIAEGIETPGELRQLQALGIHLFQGYLFARPAFEALPQVNWPAF